MLSLNAKALKAIDEAVVFSVKLEASADIVRAQVQGQDREAVREAVIHRFAWKAGIVLTVQGTGRIVWPKADPRTEKAKRACNRFISLVLGKEPKQPAKTKSDLDKAVEAFEKLGAAERKRFMRLIGQ